MESLTKLVLLKFLKIKKLLLVNKPVAITQVSAPIPITMPITMQILTC